MKKNKLFVVLNFVLLFGMGVYLSVYIIANEVDLTSGLTYLAGTLMGYSIYSTLTYLKLTKIL